MLTSDINVSEKVGLSRGVGVGERNAVGIILRLSGFELEIQSLDQIGCDVCVCLMSSRAIFYYYNRW